MDARLIAVASPIFFVLIFVELYLLRRRQEPVYRLHDSLADLSCGVGEQVCQAFTFVLELALYSFVWSRFRVHTFPIHSVAAWIALILLLDLAYYWFHRASHRVNFLWAVHGVHHQSEEFNFAVALRQGWIEPLTITLFHIPIALLGFPPAMFFIGFTAHTLWQFWPHTRGIGKLPIDSFMNSPANHRGHHAINPVYIDKNYSGLFVVWDRLFGTWAPEAEPAVFGTVKPLASYNPLWANVSYWVEMARLVRACPSLADKLSVPFRPPEWRPAALGGPVTIPEISRSTQRRYDVRAPRGVNAYVLSIFALVILALPLLTQSIPALTLGGPARVAVAAWFIACLLSIAGLVEKRGWASWLEALRLLSLPALAWLVAPPHVATLATLASAAFALVQAIWLTLIRRRG